MIVLFRSDAGPIEGFESATFRTAVNDDGAGEIVGPPDVIARIDGDVVCEVDGQVVFAWTPEDRQDTVGDRDEVRLTGRGRSASLERAIVLPVGYPNFTSRTRTETGAPLAVLSTLLAEAQARGRAAGLTPTWTATEDSNGDPWTETVSVQLEPGTHLRDLLDNMAEVEGAEWIVRADGTLDAAPQIGQDRSGQVVLFLGHDQIGLNRTGSFREQRQTVYVEASTGVSEATNSSPAGAGEIWLEAQDYADTVSRQALADKLALKLGAPTEEADISVPADAGAFVDFFPGDLVGLDAGAGPIEPVRVVGLTVNVTDQVDVSVEATLITEVALRQQRIERAIEAKADVKLAASPSIQRRHGLVTADKFLSGAVGDAVAISSEDYVPSSQGWVIRGDGDAEFNNVVVRGDLESDNYDPGVDGWRLDRDGTLELNEGTFRGGLVGGTINIGGADGFYADGVDGIWLGSSSFDTAAFRVSLTGQARAANMLLTNGTLTGGSINIGNGTFTVSTSGAISATSGSISGNLVTSGISAGNITAGTLNVDRIAAGSITGAKIQDATLTGVKIIDGEIGGVKIADLAISTGKIQNNAVRTAKIRDGDVTNAKIDTLAVGKLTGTTISGFGGNFLTFQALSVTSTLSNMLAPGYSVSSSSSFYGSSARVASTIRYDGAPGSTDFGLPVISRRADNVLVVFTSSRRYKTDIQDVTPPDRLLDLRLRSYLPIDGSHGRTIGLIAEEVEDLGLTSLVKYDLDGKPLSVSYDLVGAMLVPHVRDLVERVSALEEGTRAE